MFIAITYAMLYDARFVCDFALTHDFNCSAMILLEMILRYIAVGNANKFWSKNFHRLECLLIFLTFIGTSLSYLPFLISLLLSCFEVRCPKPLLVT